MFPSSLRCLYPRTHSLLSTLFFGFSLRFRGPLGTPCLTRFPLKSWVHLFHINLNTVRDLKAQSYNPRMKLRLGKMKIAQSCPTLCDPMDYGVHGILQARILEWVAIPFSRESSQPSDRNQVSCIAGNSFPAEPKNSFPFFLREAQEYWSG